MLTRGSIGVHDPTRRWGQYCQRDPGPQGSERTHTRASDLIGDQHPSQTGAYMLVCALVSL
jgi:hypothetical protein